MAQTGFFGENLSVDHFPGSDGYPIIGHTLEFYRDFYRFGLKMLSQYGEIYRSRAALLRYVVIASPDAAKFVLKDNEENFSCKQGWEIFFGRVFPNSLPVMDDQEHKHHRRILQSVFKKPNMVSYVELMDSIAARAIDGWGEGNSVKMFPLCKQLTLDIAAKAFLGINLQGEAEFVGNTFITLNKGIGALVPVPVPGLALWKSLRAQRKLLDFFRPMINEKRSSTASDMFSRLCQAKDEGGSGLSDDAILYHLLQFLAAAHDTTTATLGAIVHFFVKYPEWQEKVKEEIVSLGKDQLTFDDMDRLVKIEWVIKEALRHYLPIPLTFRRVVHDCEYKGMPIKAGTQILIDLAAIHHSELYWKNASQFDPARFSPERCEHKTHSYSWFPFGGGSHTCMGLHFAIMELKVVIFHILKKYKIELAENREDTFQILPVTKPRNNLPVKLTMC